MVQTQSQGANQAIIPSQFSHRVTDHTLHTVGQIRVRHPNEQVVRRLTKTFSGEKIIHFPVAPTESLSGLFDKCIPKKLYKAVDRRAIRDCGESEFTGKKPRKCVYRVVPIKLSFLKWVKVRPVKKSTKPHRRRMRDLYRIKRLDEEGFVRALGKRFKS